MILSCSHVFHTQCLSSFERFSRVKMCPLCRKVEYDKKDYFEGHRILLMRYIVKIQALVRGYLQRLHFCERLKNEGMPL